MLLVNSQQALSEVDINLNSSFSSLKMEEEKGTWELDINTRQLVWSPNQYKIYGYEPNEFNITEEFFILKTTHAADVDRIFKIVRDALKKANAYNFKRRIIRKDGSLGFVETQARILRLDNGKPYKIVGTTTPIDSGCEPALHYNSDLVFFNQIYSKYKGAIFFYIYKNVFDQDIAKDLCQEIFIKVWKNISNYKKEKGEIYTWLINITKNHCKDYYKSQHFQKGKVTIELDHIKEKHAYFGNSNGTDIRKLLSLISPEQSEIINMLFIDGFTHAEVAKIRKLPLGTLKAKSRKAIQRLRLLSGEQEHNKCSSNL